MKTARLSESELATFASHLAGIMMEHVEQSHTREKPKKIGYSLGSDFRVEIHFWHRGELFLNSAGGSVWDQTCIVSEEHNVLWDETKNGILSTGNRYGAVQHFTALVFEHFSMK